jgi:hypothetical protein
MRRGCKVYCTQRPTVYKDTTGRAARLLATCKGLEDRKMDTEAVTCAKVLLALQRGCQAYSSEAIIFLNRLMLHKVYQLSQLSTKAASGIIWMEDVQSDIRSCISIDVYCTLRPCDVPSDTKRTYKASYTVRP